MSNTENLNDAICIKKNIKFTLAQCLGDLTREQLKAYVKNYDIKGTSKLKKDELIAQISKYILSGNIIKEFITDATNDEKALLEKNLNSEYIDIKNCDPKNYVRLFLLGITFPYLEEEEYKLVIPIEVKELLKTIILSENKDVEAVNKAVFNNNKKIGRNEKCPCGSGKKYKKCCLNK
ncbi:MAG: SEC-C metal-binding domain-containing protein [Sarcina sp.]